MKKKVIILGTAYPYRAGGISTFNERMAQAFIDNGDDVTIYNFRLQYPSFLFPGKTQISSESAPDGLKIERKVNSINPLNWLIVGMQLRKMKPDLIVIRYWIPFMAPCLGTISRIARSNHHTVALAVTDNIIPHEKFPFGKFLSQYFASSCDAFVAMSRSVLSDLQKLVPNAKKIYSAHPLYDNFGQIILKKQAKQVLNLDAGTSYILFFGFIREYKGLDLLLNAFADSRLRKYKVKLLVVGEYYIDSKPYEKIISEKGLSEWIEMKTEFVPNSEIHKYFCAADIVAQPYKSATQSGVTQIAYHFGVPMLTTNVGGLAEIVIDSKVGYVVNPVVSEIAEALVDFYSEQRENIFRENVKIERKRFVWDKFISNLEGLFMEVSKT